MVIAYSILVVMSVRGGMLTMTNSLWKEKGNYPYILLFLMLPYLNTLKWPCKFICKRWGSQLQFLTFSKQKMYKVHKPMLVMYQRQPLIFQVSFAYIFITLNGYAFFFFFFF